MPNKLLNAREQNCEYPFSFTEENLIKAQNFIKQYPAGREMSAVLSLLDLAQRQLGGWISRPALEYVAEILKIPIMRIYEVASFYTMFNLNPRGKYLVQVCTTTPCLLRGADEILKTCQKHLHVTGGTTEDGLFTLKEVECLGACINAPVIQMNDDYLEDLTPKKVTEILKKLGRKKDVE